MPKAASTSIQSFLTNNRGQLAQTSSVLYPETGKLKKHRDAFLQLSARNEEIDCLGFYKKHRSYERHLRNNAAQQDAFSHLRREITDSDMKKILCSEEMIWDPITFNKISLQRIKDELNNFDVEVFVVAILRDQWSWLISHYAELIKSGRLRALQAGPTYTFDQFLWRTWASGALNYKRRLQDFSDVFGGTNIRAVWLEDVPKNQIVKTFFNLCDITPVDGATVARRENRRPSWSAVRTVRLTNKLSFGRAVAARAVLKIDGKVQRIGGQSYVDWRPPFDESLSAQVREIFATDNAAITQEFAWNAENETISTFSL